MAEEPNTQPGTPPERPIFNPETLKEEIAGTEGVREKIDTLNETLEAIKKAKKDALEDIKADISKAYPPPSGPDEPDENKIKRENEYKSVEKMLSRLEGGYLQAAKESKAEIKPGDEALYEFDELIDEYFKELQTITGDITPEAGAVDLKTVDPYKFWENTVGWYEKTEGTEEFKEGKIEEEGERWKEAIHDFKEENSTKIKEGEKENFQNWIETHREDLRRVILRQIGDRKYIVDFTNLSKEFEKSLAGNARAADFIAKNIGLADLFADVSQAITVWKGDALYTGKLNTDYSRINGLKGGYFYNDKYLEIWHGAVISTNPKDQIAENTEDFLSNDMFEAPKEEEKPKEASSFPEIQQATGDKVINLVYKPGVDENDTPNETQKRIIEDGIEPRIRTLDKENTGSFKLDYKYDEVYGPGTIEKKGETIFEKQKEAPDYSNINNEIVYTSKEFPNIEILIPFSKTDCYLLRTKTQQDNTETPTVTVYEFTDLETLKVQLGKEVETQEKSAKKTLKNENIEVMKLDKNCSEKTTKSQIKEARTRYAYERKDPRTKKTETVKVIIYGSLPTGFVPEKKEEGKPPPTKITVTDSELTQEGLDKLPIDEKITNINVEKGENMTLDSLNILLAKTPKATKLSLKGSDLSKDTLYTIASRLHDTLEELDLSYAAFELSDLKYLESCTKLRTLDLSYTAVTDFEIKNYISERANLQTLNLSNTEITDKSLEDLAKLENLTSLGLSGTDTSLEATVALQKKLPSCEITWSEKAMEELKKIVRKKLEENANKIEEEINILPAVAEENLSFNNLQIDEGKQRISADIYFENQKISTINITTTIREESGEEISFENFLKKIVLMADPTDKIEKGEKEISDNQIKQKITIGRRTFHVTEQAEFTGDMEKNIATIKQEKKEKKYIEDTYANPSDLARACIAKIFKDKEAFITYESPEITRDKQMIRMKLLYKGENIGQIDMDLSKKEAFLLDDKGAAVQINHMTTKMDSIDKRKKTEEKAAAQEKIIAQENEYKKETIKSLNGTLASIDKNLKIGDRVVVKDSTAESGRKYFQLTVTYFGENIGRIQPWADLPIENQLDADKWVELETEVEFKIIEGENLKQKLTTLKQRAVEEIKEKKIKEFEWEIEKANKEIFGEYYQAGDMFTINTETIEIKYGSQSKRPYVEAEISLVDVTYVASEIPADPIITTTSIGYISDWMIGESGLEISNKKSLVIKDGATIIDKLKKLKEEAEAEAEAEAED